MDPVTHAVVGAGLAYSVSAIKAPQDRREARLCWQLGALAALLPDLDYLLFWLDPLAFLAYWHRAFTHSLLLAPLWSLTVAVIAYLLTKHRYALSRLWLVATLGVLSHCLMDGLTPFGTQWFQPLSDVRVSANLLLVVDGYFSLILLFCLWVVWRYQRYKAALLIWLLPMAYLLAVTAVKQHVRQDLSARLPPETMSSEVHLIPQPFSPLLWQALIRTSAGSWQARIYYGSRAVPLPLSLIPPLVDFERAYRPSEAPQWRWRPLWPESAPGRVLVQSAWVHPDFTPFRDFARFPVLYHRGTLPSHSPPEASTCVWFSDLRYHWPGIPPAFRFGLCQQPDGLWQVERLPYFVSL